MYNIGDEVQLIGMYDVGTILSVKCDHKGIPRYTLKLWDGTLMYSRAWKFKLYKAD